MGSFRIYQAIILVLASAKKYTTTRAKSRPGKEHSYTLLSRSSNDTALHIFIQVIRTFLICTQPLLKLLLALLLYPLVFQVDPFDTQAAFVVASRAGVQDVATEIRASSMAASSTEEFVTTVV